MFLKKRKIFICILAFVCITLLVAVCITGLTSQTASAAEADTPLYWGVKNDGTYADGTEKKVLILSPVSTADTPTAYSISNNWISDQTITEVTVKEGTKAPSSMSGWFSGQNLINVNLSNLDTSDVTDMTSMFYYSTKITYLDLSSFDTSKVASMKNMFVYCSGLTYIDLSSFDTSEDPDIKLMFSKCDGLEVIRVSDSLAQKLHDDTDYYALYDSRHSTWYGEDDKVYTNDNRFSTAGTYYVGKYILTIGTDKYYWNNIDSAWRNARFDSSATTPATVKMNADATVGETLTVDTDKNITLDLNGHKLEHTGASGSVVKVDGTFTLDDSTKHLPEEQKTVHTVNGNEIKGGLITGGKNSGVYVYGGSFTMEGGTIAGNTATNGGGVYVDGGTFYMNGGEISGNAAETYGGGVFVANVSADMTNGTFNMTDGKISGNTAGSYGGGVYVPNSTFIMSGGTISDNIVTGQYGGGGGVFAGTGTFNMSGTVTITGNKKGKDANNVAGEFNVTGVLEKDGKKAQIGINRTGAVVVGFTAANVGGDAPSAYFIPDNSANDCVYISDEPTGTVSIGTHTGGTATCNAKAKCEKCDQEYGELGTHNFENGFVCTFCSKKLAATLTVSGSNTYYVTFDEAWEAANNATQAAKITMNADATVSQTLVVNSGANITLDLNGYKITYTGTSGSVITVNGTFTLEDNKNNLNYNPDPSHTITSPVTNKEVTIKGGLITGGKGTSALSSILGGAIYVDGGNFTMNGGTLAGNTAIGHGGAIRNGGTFTMAGGTIMHNKSGCGGGVCVCNGNFVMTDGEISYNESTDDGGGVFYENDAEGKKFVLSGGEISNNIAATIGGGVHVYKGVMEMSGSSVISGNVSNQKGGGIYVTSALKMSGGTIGGNSEFDKNTAMLGGGVYVDTKAEMTFTGGDIKGNFADSGAGGVLVKGKLAMSEAAAIENNATGECGSGGGVFVFDASASFTMSGGCISNNTSITTGGGVTVQRGVLILSGGNINRNTSSVAAGIQLQNGGTLKMSGGSITDNIATNGNWYGGGIYCDSDCFIEFSGAPVIKNNKTGGVFGNLYIAKLITVTGEFTSGAQICLDICEPITVTQNFAAYNSSANPTDFFRSDSATYNCIYLNSGEAAVGRHTGGTASCTKKAKCLVCQAEYGNLASHDFANSTTYKSDGTQHWKQCANCTAEDTDNKVNHTGGTASCTEKAKCLVCQAEYGNLASHDFANSTTYKSDGTQHWKQCANCTAEDTGNKVNHNGTATCTEKAKCSVCQAEYGELAAHTATDDNNCSTALNCTVCGSEVKAAKTHVFTGSYQSDGDEHWHVCTNEGCTVTDTKADHSPEIDDDDCTTEIRCWVCNAVTTAANAAHNFSGAWNYDGTGHWHACKNSGCYGTEKFSHNCNQEVVDPGYIKLPASCNRKAVYYKSCECGFSDKDEAKTFEHGGYAAHTFGAWQNGTAATCSATGTKAHKDCTVCHKHFDNYNTEITDLTIAIIPTAHSYGDWSVTTPATCESAGVQTRTCAHNSAHKDTQPIPVEGHSYAETFTVDTSATCESAGSKSRHCTRQGCNSKTDVTIIPAAGHTFGEWQDGTAATCSATGTKAHKDCSVCHKHFDNTGNEIADLTVPVDSTAHGYATEWTKDESGHWHAATCEHTTEKGGFAVHTAGDWITDTEPQVGVAGGKHKECTVCGYTTESEAIPALKEELIKPDENGGENQVVVTTPEGFTPDIELVVTEIEKENYGSYEAIANTVNGEINLVYDVTLKSDGVAIQPDGTLTIKLLIPTDLRGKNFKLFHLHGSEAADMEYAVDGNYAVVTTDRLSEFIFVGEKTAVAPAPDGFNPLWLILIITVSLVIVGEVGYIVYRKVRKNKAAEVQE